MKVRQLLKDRGILVLHVDEINNLVGTANQVEIKRIRNSLKALINRPDWPVVLVLSGTPDCAPILQAERQLKRRLDWISLAPLAPPGDNKMVIGQVRTLCETAGIAPPTDSDRKLALRLMHASGHQFGTAIDIAIRSIQVALRRGAPKLALEHFATAFARRTDGTAAENPFLASTWRSAAPAWRCAPADEDDDGAADEPSGSEGPRSRGESSR